jgi:hypothetical protein
MKKTIFSCIALIAFSSSAFSQSSTANNNQNAGQTKFIGFNNNFPLRIHTNGTQRMHINQNRNSAIGGILGGFNVVTDGYVGIGPNTGNIWTTKGPFSLLHLNGGQVGALGSVQELGFRPWMQTGISFTGFNDFAYVGYRHVTGNTNEFVINWSNDPAVVAGPDDMVFRFTQGYDFTAPNPDDPLARIDNNFTASDDMDGRHIARFTPTGEFGLGPNFGHTFDNTAYVRPQSMLHMSSYQQQDAWMQVTNQTGTAETANDGLRIGVTGTGTAHIKQQEELPLILYTGATELMRLIPANTSTSTPAMVGIGNFSTTTPYIGAKLDIDGDLRIRTVTQDNTLTQVLVIDPNDHNRVHWRAVSSIGGGGTGGSVTADNGLKINPSANNVQLGGPLVDPTIIDLNSKYLHFSNFGRIGIGTLSNAMMNIKNITNPSGANWANVLRLENSNGAELLTFTDHKRLTINAERNDLTGFGEAVSISSKLSSSSPGSALNGFNVQTFTDETTNLYRGGLFVITANSTQTVTGLFVAARIKVGESTGIGNYIGINGAADRTTTGSNIGVLGEAYASTLNIGVKGIASGTSTSWAGYFQGNVHVVGAITATGTITTISDQLFKTNINPISNASSIINQLQPKVYNLDSANFTQFGFDNKQHMGLIAQEVELILPNLVSNNIILAQTDSLGNEITPQVNYKGLNYQELIPLMIAGMKEQQQVINDLKATVENLENCLKNTNICEEGNRTINQNPTTETNQKSIELINTNSIILDQNLPNPFAEHTVINYNIPDDVMEAKLMFYDFNGRIIKELVIEERGESKLTVYGTNLKTGVYTYSLIADGELIATKKMMKK